MYILGIYGEGSNPSRLIFIANLIQLVEFLICNQGVKGSSPFFGSHNYNYKSKLIFSFLFLP